MSETLHDSRLLYSVNNIRAFHIQDGEEQELTPSGPQTLSLLMVPTTTGPPMPPYAAGAGAGAGTETPEEDFYLHLYLPPELDLALPATTQIFHQPPDSYLIPRWDVAPEAGAFIRIQFPSIGSGPKQVTQDDVDTFETILAQCTAFLDRAPASKTDGHAAYNPADYGPGEGYISSSDNKADNAHGKIVLVDEEDGSVVGELGDGYDVVEDPDVKPGSKRESRNLSLVIHWSIEATNNQLQQAPWVLNFPVKARVIESVSAMSLRSTSPCPAIRHTRIQRLCRLRRPHHA